MTGTPGGTDNETLRLRALRKLTILQDRERENGRDNRDNRPVPTVLPTSSRRDASGTVAPAFSAHHVSSPIPPPINLAALPFGPCESCRGRIWWRLSVFVPWPRPVALRAVRAARSSEVD